MLNPVPKHKPIRDKPYLAFVRTLPCIICGREGSEAHHQPAKGHGTMGGKPGDDRALCLCLYHHAFGGTKEHPGSYHGKRGNIVGWSFWAHYGVDVEEWIERINRAFEIKMGRKVGEKLSRGKKGEDQ